MDAIVEAASQVLVKVGYDRATTGLVASTAGVSVGSLYQYFPNKESIFSLLLQRQLQGVIAAMMEALARSAGRPFREQLAAVVAALLTTKAQNPRLHRVLKTELGRLDGTRVLKRMNERSLELTRMFLEVHRDQLGSGDPQRTAFLLVNAMDGILNAVVMDAPESLSSPALACELTDLAHVVITGTR